MVWFKVTSQHRPLNKTALQAQLRAHPGANTRMPDSYTCGCRARAAQAQRSDQMILFALLSRRAPRTTSTQNGVSMRRGTSGTSRGEADSGARARPREGIEAARSWMHVGGDWWYPRDRSSTLERDAAGAL